jgi:hypothetical protein
MAAGDRRIPLVYTKHEPRDRAEAIAGFMFCGVKAIRCRL